LSKAHIAILQGRGDPLGQRSVLVIQLANDSIADPLAPWNPGNDLKRRGKGQFFLAHQFPCSVRCARNEISGVPLKMEFSLVEDRKLLAGLRNIFDHMRRKHHYAILGKLRKRTANTNTLLWVKSGSRFIHNKDARIAEQCLSDAKPP